MKRLFAILLLFVLSSPFLGVYLVHYHQQKEIKRNAKKVLIAGVATEDLVHFKFTKHFAATQLNWEHDREFEFESQWYDIVKADTIGDTIHYTLWWDAEETELNKRLKQNVERLLANNPERKKNNETLLQFAKQFYFSQSSFCIFAHNLQLTSIPNYLLKKHKNPYLEAPSPPPQF